MKDSLDSRDSCSKIKTRINRYFSTRKFLIGFTEHELHELNE